MIHRAYQRGPPDLGQREKTGRTRGQSVSRCRGQPVSKGQSGSQGQYQRINEWDHLFQFLSSCFFSCFREDPELEAEPLLLEDEEEGERLFFERPLCFFTFLQYQIMYFFFLTLEDDELEEEELEGLLLLRFLLIVRKVLVSA